MQARFAGPVAALPALPGLHVHVREADRLNLEYTGPLPELLSWLAEQPLAELRVEPLGGLYSVYHRYHGSAP